MSNQLVQRLVVTRTAIGVGAWLAPRFSGRLFGLDPDANPQASYLGRLFGVRDVALGVGLSSSSGPDRQQWLRLGVACDLADAAAGVLAGRAGALPKRATVLVTGTALMAAAMGLAAMRTEEPAPAS
jgi:hypothetical protein